MWITLLSILLLLYLLLKTYTYYICWKYRNRKTGKWLDAWSPEVIIFSQLFSNPKPYITHYDIMTKYNTRNFSVFFGPALIYVVGDSEDVHNMLMNHRNFPKFEFGDFDYFTQFFGKNVVLSNGDTWMRHRKIVNPAFFNISRFAPVFLGKIDEFFKVVKNQNHLKLPNVTTHMSNLTLDILGKTAFNYDFNCISGSPDSKEVLEAYHFIMQELASAFRFMIPVINKLKFLPSNQKLEKSLRIMDDLIYSLIAKAKNERDEVSLLHLMTAANQVENDEEKVSFTDEELHGNLTIFFVAGHDTTSISLTFVLYSLCKHPEIQEKLIKEIDTLFVTEDDILDTDKVQNAEYLHMFLQENLRLYPPVVSSPARIMEQDTVLSDGYVIPKGTLTNLAYGLVNRDPNTWGKDSLEFKPERFQSHSYSRNFVSFALGPRKCIGANFSLLEQKLFVIRLLQQFRVEYLDQKPYTMTFKDSMQTLLNPDQDFGVQLVPRKDK